MADLKQIERTLLWIESRLPSFDPLPHGNPDYLRLKAFAELSIVFVYLSEWSSDLAESSSIVEHFRDRCFCFIRDHSERSVYVEAARKDPLRAYAFALPYLLLRAKGYRSQRHEQLMQWLSGFCLPLSVESLPYREWDRQHFLWKSGCLIEKPSWEIYYRSTTLAMRKGTIYYDADEAYSITHTLFYMTDFGMLRAPLPDRERTRVGLVLRSLLVHHWRLKNWDLTGELLICLTALGSSRDSCVMQASAAFEKLVREDGTIPAHGKKNNQGSRRGKRQRLKTMSVDAYTLSCYHPTFVWLLYSISKCNGHARN